jgi:hypothetical protein
MSWVVRDRSSGTDAPVSVHPRTQDGYTEALKRFYEFEAVVYPPFFRRRGVGWVLLNILIGFFLAGMLLFVTVAVVFGVNADLVEGPGDVSDDAYDSSSMICLAAGVLGWMLFSYLRSLRARWVWLTIVYVGGIVAGAAVLASAVPSD